MKKIKDLVPQEIKNLYHLAQAILASFLYGFPSRKIKVIGVTGTNGKTTTVQMISKILDEAGHKVAMSSTINYKIGEKEWVNKSKYTTLSSFQVQKFIKRAVRNNCSYLVLETSSHSLDQFRVWGVDYETAVITNVTREHLDYHKTMDKYRKAKLKLFRNVKNAIVNMDMEKPEYFLQFNSHNKILYTRNSELDSGSIQLDSGSEAGMTVIRAENVELNINNSSYKLQTTNYKLNLPGLFNIENALAATCVGISEGIGFEKISDALSKIKVIPGRLEHVSNDKGIDIIIDYAVTPDSLEKLYQLIAQTKKDGSRIISVFGSCGERDRGKRPIMGEIVSKYADSLIVTNEDPYNEDPKRIIDEVFSGIKSRDENRNCWRIVDRRGAIKKALAMAEQGDVVVVTGKGAEETMAVGNRRIPWNDKKVIRELLQELE